jgi:hypothetical protein
MVVIAIGAIVALLWGLGGLREGFSTVNPMLSDADAQSIEFNPRSTSGNAATFQQWFWNAYPSVAKYDMSISTIADNLAAYAKIAPDSVSGAPALNDFYTQLASALSTGKPSMFAKTPQDIATSYAITDPSKDTTGIYANVIYSYYFGNTPAPTPYVPPTPPSISGTASTPKTSSPISASTNPSPASSSSTQPMTIGVPSPCRNSYKSIPGGSMEFKCFN